MEYQADLFICSLRDGWRDETVHRFVSPDREDVLRIRVERKPSDAPLEQRLLEKTATVREGIPNARLVWEQDAIVGSEPAKAFRIDGDRGDEVPLSYLGMLARWGERRLLIIEYECPTARFDAGEAMVRDLAAGMRRRAGDR